jgi:23S rRNA (guanosine2251-2'-O)-methyltransferase
VSPRPSAGKGGPPKRTGGSAPRPAKRGPATGGPAKGGPARSGPAKGGPAKRGGAPAPKRAGSAAPKRSAGPATVRSGGLSVAKRAGAAAPKRGGARGAKPLGEGAERALAREQRKSRTPLSNSARKAVAGKYERQAASSDTGRQRVVAETRRVAEGRGPKRLLSARRTSDRTLGGEQVEGRQAVRELLLAGTRKVYEVWVATDVEDAGVISDIADLAADQRVPVVEVNRRRLEQVARSEAPQGVLAKAAALPEAEFEDLLRRRDGRPPFLLAVDGVTDPGNLGALLRTAEGAGVTGVLLPRHRAVHITPTVAKSAAGAIEYLSIAVVPGLPNALAQCRAKGLWVVGLDDAADRPLFELGELGRDGIVVVLGAEGAGLSRLARERCDTIVSIPMRGRIGSLNVSNAGALALYEVTRARTMAGQD